MTKKGHNKPHGQFREQRTVCFPTDIILSIIRIASNFTLQDNTSILSLLVTPGMVVGEMALRTRRPH